MRLITVRLPRTSLSWEPGEQEYNRVKVAADRLPASSDDGRWVFFQSVLTGTREVWKIPAASDETKPQRVTVKGGAKPEVSVDRRYLYYFKPYQPIWSSGPRVYSGDRSLVAWSRSDLENAGNRGR